MRLVNFLLSIRPLLLRRLFLVLFAGPILIVAALGGLVGWRRYSIHRLCWSFDSAWTDRDGPLSDPSSS